MSDLLKEIQDDIRQERLHRLWVSFGKIMIGVSVGVVIFTIVLVAWQNYRQGRDTESTTQFLSALTTLNVENYSQGMAALDALSANPSSDYYGPAMLKKAEVQLSQNHKDEALATYRELKERGKGDNLLFARLAALKLASISNDPVTPDTSSPFLQTEKEWQAWQQLSAGKTNEAAEIFLALSSDLDAPQSLRSRAGAALMHIAPEKFNQAAK